MDVTHRAAWFRIEWIPALLAALCAFLVSHFAYLHRPLTTDENSYLFQAQCFLEGRVSREAPAIPEAYFHYMIILDEQAGWLSRYPPAHSIWLMPGLLLNQPRLMSVLGAALGIMLMAAIGRQFKIPGLLPALMLLLSPFYAFIYGSLLSHTSGFLAAAAMLLCYVRWQRSDRPVFAALAGVFWGLLFLNRTFAAMLLALPFGADALVSLARHRTVRRLAGCLLFAGLSLVCVAAFLGYNRLTVGNAWLSTYLFYDPSEGLGFGPRHTGGLIIHHTFLRGIQNVWHNLLSMDVWLWGFRGGLAAALLLGAIGWNRRWSPLLLASALSVWAGHVFFWFPGIENIRPAYYFETLPFIMLGAAFGLQRLRLFLIARAPGIPRAAFALIPIAMLAASYPFIARTTLEMREYNREQRFVHDLLQQVPDNSIVFFQRLHRETKSKNMLNLKGLESDPLTVIACPFRNDVLAEIHEGRSAFMLVNDRPPRLAAFERNDTLRHEWQAVTSLRHLGANIIDESGRSARTADPSHEPGFLAFGRYLYVKPGEWRVIFHCSLEDVDGAAPVRFEVATDRGHNIPAAMEVSGTEENKKVELSVTSRILKQIEPRVVYGGSGTVRVYTIIVEPDA